MPSPRRPPPPIRSGLLSSRHEAAFEAATFPAPLEAASSWTEPASSLFPHLRPPPFRRRSKLPPPGQASSSSASSPPTIAAADRVKPFPKPTVHIMGDRVPFVPDSLSQVGFLSIEEVDANNLLLQGEEKIEMNNDNEGGVVCVDYDGNENEGAGCSSDIPKDDRVMHGTGEGNVVGATPIGKPFVGQEFDSSEYAYHFYNCYALKEGFGTRKSKANRSCATREVIWRRFVCNKQGFKDLKDNRVVGKDVQRRRDTREGCLAWIDVSLKQNKKWVVTVFEEKHTHDLTSPSKVAKHHSHNKLHKKECYKSLIDQLHGCGMQPSRIAKAINATSVNEAFGVTPEQVKEHLREQRKNNVGREGVTVALHFQKKKSLDPNFYFAMELDTEGTLRSMFWADSRSRNAYLNFGDVVVFDVTYKTNKFMMPFAPFTGVNHHRQSILFGCALLADETEETFVWLFEQWLTCMFGKAPGAIITDMDGAMRNAIKRIFPNTRHRFCSWHISKHLIENVQPLRDHHSEFSKDYREWFKSKNVIDCEMRWQTLVEKHQVEGNSWLAKMWELRYHWVPAYLKDTFFAGMTSSGRSESINAFFDGYVNSNTPLHEFVKQYDKALASRHKAEADEDFKTMNSKAILITRSSIEAQAGDRYTRKMFKLFQEEFRDSVDCWHEKLYKDGTTTTYSVGISTEERKKWCTVTYDEFECVTAKCDCAKFEIEGFLCKHILHIMSKKHLTNILERYILKRWTIGARYQVGGGVPLSQENESDVTPFMKWCLIAKANKLLHEADNSIFLYRKLNATFDACLVEINQSKKDKQIALDNLGSQVDSTTLASEAICDIPEISIRDPQAVRTKGRPRVASRIPYGVEVAQSQAKKRKCGVCGERGHYATTCPKKTKMKPTEEEEDAFTLIGHSDQA